MEPTSLACGALAAVVVVLLVGIFLLPAAGSSDNKKRRKRPMEVKREEYSRKEFGDWDEPEEVPAVEDPDVVWAQHLAEEVGAKETRTLFPPPILPQRSAQRSRHGGQDGGDMPLARSGRSRLGEESRVDLTSFELMSTGFEN